MRIAIAGSAGTLGLAVAADATDEGHELDCWTRSNGPDLLSIGDIYARLKLKTPDALINCAGAVPQRPYTDTEMVAVNALAPHVMAAACKLAGIPMVHVSTDCVFSHFNCYRLDHATDEPPSPRDLYGSSKLAGEPKGALVVRTSFISPAAGLWSWLKAEVASGQKAVPGHARATWTGSTVEAVAEQLIDVALPDALAGETGIRHLATAGHVTKSQLLRHLLDWGGLPKVGVYDVGAGYARALSPSGPRYTLDPIDDALLRWHPRGEEPFLCPNCHRQKPAVAVCPAPDCQSWDDRFGTAPTGGIVPAAMPGDPPRWRWGAKRPEQA